MRNAGIGLVAVIALLARLGPDATAEGAGRRYLIYLHGRIVQEQQSARPQHPQFGFYELDKIRNAFRNRGFVVSGDIRPKSASISDSANLVVEQVKRLLESGAPADRIMVVGASMGAAITLLASARLQNPDLRFAVLGACLSESAGGLLAGEGKQLAGRVLSIREATDDVIGACPPWKSQRSSSLVAQEIVLNTGLSHGFLYRPMPEWVDPVVKWAETAGESAQR